MIGSSWRGRRFLAPTGKAPVLGPKLAVACFATADADEDDHGTHLALGEGSAVIVAGLVIEVVRWS